MFALTFWCDLNHCFRRMPMFVRLLFVFACLVQIARAEEPKLSEERVVFQIPQGDIEFAFFPEVCAQRSSMIMTVLESYHDCRFACRWHPLHQLTSSNWLPLGFTREIISSGCVVRHVEFQGHGPWGAFNKPMPFLASWLPVVGLIRFLNSELQVDKGFVAQTADVMSGRNIPLNEQQRAVGGKTVPLEVKEGVKHVEGVRLKFWVDMKSMLLAKLFKYTSVKMNIYILPRVVSGMVSMARGGPPDSGGSSFFIMFGKAPHLDMQYGIFG